MSKRFTFEANDIVRRTSDMSVGDLKMEQINLPIEDAQEKLLPGKNTLNIKHNLNTKNILI